MEKELESTLWMIGKLSPALSNLVGSLAMNECHDEITQRRHDLWSMARAKLRAVLLIGGIRVSKLGSQISREGGLVLLDREHSLATQGIDPLEKVGLSVHGIGRTHTPS